MIKKLRNFKNNLKPSHILIGILLLTAILRIYNLGSPATYVFDEVYHAFTAKEYLANHQAAWEWWTTPPPGVAYEWTHPPLAKEVMALSMGLLKNQEPIAYRLPGVMLGILSVYLVYLLGKKLFDSEKVALVSAFIFSLDGLNFVQSRTGMNDIYFVSMMLACMLLFLHKRFFFSAIFLGLALASKWTGIYLYGLIFILLFFQTEQNAKSKFHMALPPFKTILYYLIIPPLIYLATYTPFFLFNHNYNQTNWELFTGLQKQMWWYHTGLKAHHDYQSQWWSWPFNLVPVWYFVEYGKDGLNSNIFGTGNQPFFLLGFIAVIISLWQLLKKESLFFMSIASILILFLLDFMQSYITQQTRLIIGVAVIIFFILLLMKKGVKNMTIPLLGYFIFLLPWSLSPRIMFLYHYSPSIPFMSLLLGYQLIKLSESSKANKKLLWIFLAIIVLGFILIYPLVASLPLPQNITNLFFLTNKSKNPWDPNSSPFF